MANRNRMETEGVIGFFVNHLVLRTNLSGNPSFRELLQRVRTVTIEAYSHQDMPYDKLVSALRPDRSVDHTPFFQVLFVFADPTAKAPALTGLSCEAISPAQIHAKYDLALFMGQSEESLRGAWRYRAELFEPSTIEAISQGLEGMLRQVADNPDRALRSLQRGCDALHTMHCRQDERPRPTSRRGARLVPRQPVTLSYGGPPDE